MTISIKIPTIQSKDGAACFSTYTCFMYDSLKSDCDRKIDETMTRTVRHLKQYKVRMHLFFSKNDVNINRKPLTRFVGEDIIKSGCGYHNLSNCGGNE